MLHPNYLVPLEKFKAMFKVDIWGENAVAVDME